MIITILLIIVLIMSVGLNVAAYLIIQSSLKKIDTYELWINETKVDVETAVERMREIDKSAVFSTREVETGVFESDDQTGQVFKELLAIVEDLNQKIQ